MRTNKTDNFYALQEEDKFWMDAEGDVHNIECMDKMYVFNTVKMLQKRNARLTYGKRKLFIIPTQMLEIIEKMRVTNPEYFL